MVTLMWCVYYTRLDGRCNMLAQQFRDFHGQFIRLFAVLFAKVIDVVIEVQQNADHRVMHVDGRAIAIIEATVQGIDDIAGTIRPELGVRILIDALGLLIGEFDGVDVHRMVPLYVGVIIHK